MTNSPTSPSTQGVYLGGTIALAALLWVHILVLILRGGPLWLSLVFQFVFIHVCIWLGKQAVRIFGPAGSL